MRFCGGSCRACRSSRSSSRRGGRPYCDCSRDNDRSGCGDYHDDISGNNYCDFFRSDHDDSSGSNDCDGFGSCHCFCFVNIQGDDLCNYCGNHCR